MIPYWIWVPIVILDYIMCAYLTNRNNLSGGIWFWAMWSTGAIPIWAMVSKYSKDVVFDGMVFDIVMTITYTLSILYFTKAFQKFGPFQYAGCLAIMAGLFLFKKGV